MPDDNSPATEQIAGDAVTLVDTLLRAHAELLRELMEAIPVSPLVSPRSVRRNAAAYDAWNQVVW